MNISEIKKSICSEIDKKREKIISIGEEIYKNPELGYKERRTTELVFREFTELGLNPEKDIAVSGCQGRVDFSKNGPVIAVMGELDAVSCPEHKDADRETGAVHACGHNIQVASMIGAAIGIISSGAVSDLCGSVNFIAVPAEEFIELAFRSSLKDKGEITWFGGKQELIKKGYFDNIDISIMIHSLDLFSLSNGEASKKVLIGPSGNGFIGKEINFIGKESHAGSAPEHGINALNAAMLAISGIHAQRETFAEKDRIRVHPIITKGGDIVNVVPAYVKMETYVRGRTIEGLLDANKKVDRALASGAMAVGAEVSIKDIPGYLPLLSNAGLDDIFRKNVIELSGYDSIIEGGDFTGSFDFGDISHIMPALHPMIGGITGGLHTRNFRLTDPETAYILPAKAMAMTVADLLFNNAAKAKTIISNFKPVMSREKYLAFLESVSGIKKY